MSLPPKKLSQPAALDRVNNKNMCLHRFELDLTSASRQYTLSETYMFIDEQAEAESRAKPGTD